MQDRFRPSPYSPDRKPTEIAPEPLSHALRAQLINFADGVQPPEELVHLKASLLTPLQPLFERGKQKFHVSQIHKGLVRACYPLLSYAGELAERAYYGDNESKVGMQSIARFLKGCTVPVTFEGVEVQVELSEISSALAMFASPDKHIHADLSWIGSLRQYLHVYGTEGVFFHDQIQIRNDIPLQQKLKHKLQDPIQQKDTSSPLRFIQLTNQIASVVDGSVQNHGFVSHLINAPHGLTSEIDSLSMRMCMNAATSELRTRTVSLPPWVFATAALNKDGGLIYGYEVDAKGTNKQLFLQQTRAQISQYLALSKKPIDSRGIVGTLGFHLDELPQEFEHKIVDMRRKLLGATVGLHSQGYVDDFSTSAHAALRSIGVERLEIRPDDNRVRVQIHCFGGILETIVNESGEVHFPDGIFDTASKQKLAYIVLAHLALLYRASEPNDSSIRSEVLGGSVAHRGYYFQIQPPTKHTRQHGDEKINDKVSTWVGADLLAFNTAFLGAQQVSASAVALQGIARNDKRAEQIIRSAICASPEIVELTPSDKAIEKLVTLCLRLHKRGLLHPEDTSEVSYVSEINRIKDAGVLIPCNTSAAQHEYLSMLEPSTEAPSPIEGTVFSSP